MPLWGNRLYCRWRPIYHIQTRRYLGLVLSLRKRRRRRIWLSLSVVLTCELVYSCSFCLLLSLCWFLVFKIFCNFVRSTQCVTWVIVVVLNFFVILFKLYLCSNVHFLYGFYAFYTIFCIRTVPLENLIWIKVYNLATHSWLSRQPWAIILSSSPSRRGAIFLCIFCLIRSLVMKY